MNLYDIGNNSEHIVTIANSGDLEIDFYIYAQNFYEAAENVTHYLMEEAAKNQDIAKLDLWCYSMIYLYRQSLELLLKASIFQTITNNIDRKRVISKIRHDLKQAYEKIIEIKGLTIGDNKNAKWLMEYLSNISFIDRKSDMFRYPFGNNRELLFKKQTSISLVAIYDNMNKAYSIIKDIYDMGCFFEQEIKSYKPQLIIEEGYYYQTSVVSYQYLPYAFFPYYSSYEEVGRFLKSVIITQKKTNLFIPMCYLYRNAIELGLKRLIIEDSHIDSSKAFKIIRNKKHSILGLWNSIIDEVKKYVNMPDDITLDNLQQYIKAFHNFDKSSDLFRYPCDKDMSPYFIEPKKLDIENVAFCFEELCNFLAYVSSILNEIKDYEADMMVNMKDCYGIIL